MPSKRIIVFLCVVFLFPSILHAQESGADSTVTAITDDAEEPKRFNFAAIPVINYDPSYEWNFAAMVSVFFKASLADTVSPLSMAGAMVGYTPTLQNLRYAASANPAEIRS